MDKMLSIGKIVNFHGINGEIKFGYTKNREEQLKALQEFYVKLNGQMIKLTKQGLRFHKNYALIKFKEINSIDEMLPYKGLSVFVEKAKIKKFLEKDEFLIEELVGLDVFDEAQNYVGKVESIIKQPAEDILAVQDDEGKEHLIPFVKALVPVVDMEKKQIVINAIEGLIEK